MLRDIMTKVQIIIMNINKKFASWFIKIKKISHLDE